MNLSSPDFEPIVSIFAVTSGIENHCNMHLDYNITSKGKKFYP